MTHCTADPTCAFRLLAEGPLGCVSQSDCGQVQLSLAYLTLRLQPDAFRELTGMLAMALQQLGTSTPSPSQPLMVLRH